LCESVQDLRSESKNSFL